MRMKSIFQRWLVVFVLVAFCFTVAVSYLVQSNQAKKQAINLLRLNIADAERQISETQSNLNTIRIMTANSALAKAKAVAALIYEKPSLATNTEALEQLLKDLSVDEIVVTDGDYVIGSIPPYPNYRMSGKTQSAAFVPAITDKNFTLVQEPQLNGAKTGIVQYAGVARLDMPGIIQIGYKPERLLQAEKVADIDEIEERIRIGENGIFRIKSLANLPSYRMSKEKEHLYYETVNGINMISLAKVQGEYVLIASLPKREMYLSRDFVLFFMTFGYMVLFTVIYYLTSLLLQKVVIDGIYSVNTTLAKITDGIKSKDNKNLNEKVCVNTAKEFVDLSDGINTTVDALKEAIDNEAKRIDDELKVGHDIQFSILPKDYPVSDFYSLYADMFTAKEVGGDFYDFFPIDDKHFAMLIADVSGKGITAALYMMTAKTLIRELVLTVKDPAEAINIANKNLAKNKLDVQFMFVTAFLAILNTETGELLCVNAGHNPPLLKSADSNCWEYQRIKHSMALGVSPKAKYKAVSLQLMPGDSFFMYTDGVTEAMNTEHQQFGEERLKEFLESRNGEPSEIVQLLRAELSRYAGDCPQSDDITMVMFSIKK